MSPLRVAVAQPRSVPGDVAANVAAHVAAVVDADLVVFPELSLTGYDVSAGEVDEAVLAPLVDACKAHGSALLVGAPVAGPSIGVLLVTEHGVEPVYRKMSLGGTEAEAFVPGDAPAVVEVGGWRVGVGVCQDTRIASHLDATMAQGVDLYVAGLVHAPSELDELSERAQRITSSYAVPVAFAASAGPNGPVYPATSGGSAVWAADGTLLAEAGAEPGEVATVTLSPPRGG